MKTKLLLSVLFSFTFYLLSSQVPQGFNYQAVARYGDNLIVEKPILVKVSILSDTTGFRSTGAGVYLWEEQHSVTTNSSGLFSLVVGMGTKTTLATLASFNMIDWNAGQRFIGIKIQYSTQPWKNMGTAKINSVPYAMVSDMAKGVASGSKLSVISNNDAAVDALFEVKRQDGQTVFAVYPDAVNVYVPRSGAKGAKGGFAIGGFEGTKANPQDYFRVTPDSVRVYIDPTPISSKGAKGGFAIGGYGETKGGINNMYFNLTGASDVNLVAESPQILWYPIKKAFLAGSVHIGAVDSVGQNSTALGYRSIAMGDYSQAFGYKAKAFGDYSTSIGRNSVAGSHTIPLADNAFALGNGTKATGNDSYAFGSGAIASGYRSFAFGSVGLDDSGNPTTSPTTASQPYTVAIGMGAQAIQKGGLALGIGATASGYYSNSMGYYSIASNYYATALGFRSTAAGWYSGAFGYNARADGEGSLALGNRSWATSRWSTAVGDSAKTQADNASAFGRMAKAKGISSVAVGYNAQTSASATDAGAFGKNALAKGVSSMAFGFGAQATNTNALALGNGSIASGTNSTAMGYQSQAQGDKSIAIGSYYSTTLAIPILNLGKGEGGSGDTKAELFLPVRPTTLFTTSSKVFNRANIAQGQYSVALGNGNLATNGGLVFGSNSDAVQFGALALGTSATANNKNSISIGYESTANGIYSVAIGNNVTANSYGEFALGQFAEDVAGTADTWNETEQLFTIGNGVSATNRSNALTIYKNGKTVVRGRYAFSTFNYTYTRYIPFLGLFRDYVYGIYTNLNRDNTAIEYYYSGYFGSTGTAGTYYGLYADYRSGAAIDVAEYIYDTKANTEAADVVVADPLNKESVIKSSKPYQTSVAGAISTKPHMTMGMELVVDEATGEPLKNAKPATRLALTGRVPVKVTNENGPIVPGDLLTTSSTPGHAMKWSLIDVNAAKDFDDLKRILSENEKRRSAILGKALESFAGTTGKIIVLMSLQ